jgi:1,2-phenylacetyl-CoA epoxidase PaaB subunit
MHKKTTFVLKTSEIMKNAIGFIQQLPLDKKPYMVTISEVKNKRSLDQNALLHMWGQDYSDQTGETPPDVKEHFKVMFLPMKKTTYQIMRKPSYKRAMELKGTIQQLKNLDCDQETLQSVLNDCGTYNQGRKRTASQGNGFCK